MGRLARRLENRQHPLFEQARDLRNCALYSWREDDEDDLHGLVEENLEALSAEDFDMLLQLALEECELLDDGEDVAGCLLQAVSHVSQTIDDPDSYDTCVLFAVPIRVTAMTAAAWLAPLEDEACEALHGLLVDHELIAEDSVVTFMPRLLTPQEADALAPGDIYALSRALAEGDTDGAMQTLSEVRLRVGLEEVSSDTGEPGEEGTSYGVLTGLVSCEDEVPFVLARLVEIEHDALHHGADSDDSGEAHSELVTDLRAELDKLNEPLADALGVLQAQAAEPADRWNVLSGTAVRLERSMVTRNVLAKFAHDHCAGDVTALNVGRPNVEGDLMTYPVLRRSDGATLGVLRWREGRHESWQSALARFMTLLGGLGVMPTFDHEDVHPEDAPLH